MRMDADQVRREVEFRCQEAGSQREWARVAGISPQYVNDVIHGRREPGDAILSALGLCRVVLYVPPHEVEAAKT